MAAPRNSGATGPGGRAGTGRGVVSPVELAQACARIADEKKADGILVLDIRGLSPVADYFVIATGRNRRQMQAISEAIVREGKSMGNAPYGVEGVGEARWRLIDLGDVVVHIQTPDAREYYALEILWGDAPRVDFQPGPAPPTSPGIFGSP